MARPGTPRPFQARGTGPVDALLLLGVLHVIRGLCPQMMNVLNAVPLITTASSKAAAFSLNIRMVQVSLFCCGLGTRTAVQGGGEEEPPGSEEHIESYAQFSITNETENNSSPQSKNAIAGGSVGVGARRSVRRGHLFRGGGGVWRPRLFRCLPGIVAGRRQAGGPGEGESRPLHCLPRRRAAGLESLRCRAMRPCGTRRVGEEAQRRIAQERRWCSIGSNSNAKTPS